MSSSANILPKLTRHEPYCLEGMKFYKKRAPIGKPIDASSYNYSNYRAHLYCIKICSRGPGFVPRGDIKFQNLFMSVPRALGTSVRYRLFKFCIFILIFFTKNVCYIIACFEETDCVIDVIRQEAKPWTLVFFGL